MIERELHELAVVRAGAPAAPSGPKSRDAVGALAMSAGMYRHLTETAWPKTVSGACSG